jgi:transcriptional regulator with XRE-family HTH domain
MSGHQKFSQLTTNFSPSRKADIVQRTNQLREEMALTELRQALQLSQAELAQKLNIEQSAVSRMEKRTDMYVSHLRQAIEAMGGQLEIIARWGDTEVKITDFSELTATEES